MTDAAPPRSAAQRIRDTLTRLENDIDLWLATASDDGDPYLVPLSFLWDGATLLVATPAASSTGRNLRTNRTVRIAVGPTRDVVMIDGSVEVFTAETVPAALADAFAAKNWDAREDSPPYGFYRVTPQRLQAWRTVAELRGREIMRAGRWVSDPA